MSKITALKLAKEKDFSFFKDDYPHSELEELINTEAQFTTPKLIEYKGLYYVAFRIDDTILYTRINPEHKVPVIFNEFMSIFSEYMRRTI